MEALEPRQLCSGGAAAAIVVTAVVAPATPVVIGGHRGHGIAASVKVTNVSGSGATGSLSAKFYLSTDQVLDDQDVLAGRIPARRMTLQPSRTRVVRGVLSPPAGLPAGHYFLFAVITPGGGLGNANPLDDVGLASRRVTVVHGRRPDSGSESEPGAEICYTGAAIDCCGAGAAVFEGAVAGPEDSPPADTEPATQPVEEQPAAPPAETQPTTQPDDTQPADTQPVDTQPASPSPGDDSGASVPPPDADPAPDSAGDSSSGSDDD